MWHCVATPYECEELIRYGSVTPHVWQDSRHELFCQNKSPGESRWRGAWGPELLHVQLLQGQCHVTKARAEEIRAWIQDHMFNTAPGFD